MDISTQHLVGLPCGSLADSYHTMVPGSRVTEAGRPSPSSSCSGHGGEEGAWSRCRMALARVQIHWGTCHVSAAHLTTWLCSWSTCAASHDPLPYLRTPYTDVPTCS